MDEEINIIDYLKVILRQWKIIILVVALALAGALVKTAKEKPIYEATTTIMIRSSSSGANPLGGLAGLAGINLSSGGDASDIIELVQSRAVAAKVLADLNLRQRIKGWDNPGISDQSLIGAVQGMIKKPLNTTGLIALKAVNGDKNLVADIANGYAEALDYYWGQLNATEAKRKREYIEAQLPRLAKEMDLTGQRLKQATMLSGDLSSLSDQTPRLDLTRMTKEYELENAIYGMLKTQYEQARLDEAKEIPAFTIIDRALTPEGDWHPQKKKNLLMGLGAGLLAGVFLAFFVDYLAKIRRSG